MIGLCDDWQENTGGYLLLNRVWLVNIEDASRCELLARSEGLPIAGFFWRDSRGDHSHRGTNRTLGGNGCDFLFWVCQQMARGSSSKPRNLVAPGWEWSPERAATDP